jgi:branched-subunit amino acid transport protein
MKAPRSTGSHRLWIAVLTIGVALWAAHVAFDPRDQLPHWVGNLLSFAWLALLLAYVTSRLNDGWDTEARQRRTSARQDAGA